MNKKKLLSLLLAAVLCLSMAFGAFAAPEEESSVPAPLTQEDESSRPAQNEPDKADVVAAIMRLLGSVDLKEIKDALNGINEAVGLPRVEDFTDMAAYADALYEKFAALGLSYDHIINAVSSSEFIDWVNGILFGSGDKPAEQPADQAEPEEPAQGGDLTSPDTGISYSAAGAAAVTLLLSLGVVVLLKKRGIYAE